MLGLTTSKSTSSGSYTQRGSLIDFLTGATGGSVRTLPAGHHQISPNMQQIMQTVLQRVRQERDSL